MAGIETVYFSLLAENQSLILQEDGTSEIYLEETRNSDNPSTVVGTGTKGTRFISSRYPAADGLTSGTTYQKGHKDILEASEGSLIEKRYKKGIFR